MLQHLAGDILWPRRIILHTLQRTRVPFQILGRGESNFKGVRHAKVQSWVLDISKIKLQKVVHFKNIHWGYVLTLIKTISLLATQVNSHPHCLSTLITSQIRKKICAFDMHAGTPTTQVHLPYCTSHAACKSSNLVR